MGSMKRKTTDHTVDFTCGFGNSNKQEPLLHSDHRAPPQWVKTVVDRHHGGFIRFVMEKRIQKSDLDPNQNRLLIPSEYAITNLGTWLPYHEKREANLPDDLVSRPIKEEKEEDNNDDKEEEEEGSGDGKKKKKRKLAGRKHGGLKVELFGCQCQEGIIVTLSRWDKGATILKGGKGHAEKRTLEVMGYTKEMIKKFLQPYIGRPNEYLNFMACNKLKVDDEVEMWAFRCKKIEQLCFVLGKKETLSTELLL